MKAVFGVASSWLCAAICQPSWVVLSVVANLFGFAPLGITVLISFTLIPFRDSFDFHSMVFLPRFLQLSAMDVSVRTTMKGAAKCDKHCELQNSVNRQELERILCFWDIPESMPASVSMLCYSSMLAIVPAALSARASGCACPLLGYGALEAFD